MFIRSIDKYNFIVRSADAEGSGGGTEGSPTPSTDPGTSDAAPSDAEAEIQKRVEEAVAQAIAGLKRKNEELIGKEKRLKAELEAAAKKPSLSDDEYTQFMTLRERIERDDLLRLFAEGKSDEVIERVTKKTRIEAEVKLAAEAEARAKIEAEAAQLRSRLEQTLIHNEITKASAGSVKPQYQDLVTRLVSDRVKLVDGNVRIVNAEGEVEMTANGAKPLTVSDYIETLRGNMSDLFVTSTGGGAGGSGKPRSGSTKLSMDAAAELPMEDYMRLRREGKI